jgi:hypothetical protein
VAFDIFGFNRLQETLQHPCPACGSGTVEVWAKWRFETNDCDHYLTGIYRCLSDNCDAYHVPTMPEIHP